MKHLCRLVLYFSFLFLTVLFPACSKSPAIDESTMIDGGLLPDPSIAHPEKYLVSYALPNPTQQQKETPVVIAVHGYSATTFEWDEFHHWGDSVGTFYTSQVLLGGHGRSYEVFKNASWQDWQQPILDEYNRLVNLGFTNINLAGSSTAGPLILNLICTRSFSDAHLPRHVIFIDPIVIASSKLLSLIDIVGPAISYTETSLDPNEQGHYYQFRPQESLNQLQDLLNITRQKLEDGIQLPKMEMIIYKSKKDPSADPYSAVLLYKGITTYDGEKPEIRMVDSKLHVFTYLKGRKSYTFSDKALQLKTFKEMETAVFNPLPN
jgi:carboxylesterase